MTGRGLIHGLRSRIALKLTLTLVGFVAVSLIAAGLYLSRALERVAIEVLEHVPDTRRALAEVCRALESRRRISPSISSRNSLS